MEEIIQIPQEYRDIKELLCQQMALLAEKSRDCEPEMLARLSDSLVALANTLSNQNLI